MNSALRLGIGGASGRMGVAVGVLAADRPGIEVAARFDRPGAVGDGLVGRDEALAACEVVIDFSSPRRRLGLRRRRPAAAAPPWSSAPPAFRRRRTTAIAEAARAVAIVKSGNFSIGVNVLAGLVRQAAERLGPDLWDIEIFEAHHRRKVDAPSGTARLLGEAAAARPGRTPAGPGASGAGGRDRTSAGRRHRLFSHARRRHRRRAQRRLRRRRGDHHPLPLRPRPRPLRQGRPAGRRMGEGQGAQGCTEWRTYSASDRTRQVLAGVPHR